MSCGQIALQKLGVKVDNYYASEIDKHAIKVTKHNFPQTQHLGDVTGWRDWDIDWSSIDLIIAGSPCQGFSISGKQLAFNDPRSKLFFEFVDIIKNIQEFNPDVKFMFENVKMKKEFQQVITDFLGVEPVAINSTLVSAQSRPRLYWANFWYPKPSDKGIFLQDILQKNVGDEFNITPKWLERLKFSTDLKKRFSALNPGKALCMRARQYSNSRGTFVGALTERRTDEAKKIRAEHFKKHGKDFSPRRGKELVQRSDQKMNCLTATFSIREHSLIDDSLIYRKLTPVECERLQTVPDNYTECVSNSQRYKMLGNGWTVDVVAHIFEFMLVSELF